MPEDYEQLDFTYGDRLWFRPATMTRSPYKKVSGVEWFFDYHYKLSCDRCETNWYEELTVDGHPRCFSCGRFVKFSATYRNERLRLKKGHRHAGAE